MPAAEDLNPDPNILEVVIEAKEAEVEILPGVRSRLWTYNGMVPGPLLRAKRGDRVIVHFTNHLSEATTLHWHGLQIPADMDGTAAVQDPVQPGESFTYDFVLPDAGTYWYHPHVNSSTQVGYGLYGPIVVDEPDDPVQVEDVVLVFSDLALNSEGEVTPGDSSGWFGDYFGREGDIALINGKVRPRIKARPGVAQRWRIINAARSQFFQMRVPDGSVVRIGGDGGLIEHPLALEELVLTPSERAEVLVTPRRNATGTIDVLHEDANRFNLGITRPPETLLHMDLSGTAPTAPAPELPVPLRTFPPLDLSQATRREIVLGEKGMGGLTLLTINGEAHDEHHHHHGDESAHVAYVGDTEIWEIINTTHYDHPFHLHGFAFEVLDVNGDPWPVREWKDTANVPGNQTLRFAVTFDDRPGWWMFHCHILDHVNLGMMAALEVRHR